MDGEHAEDETTPEDLLSAMLSVGACLQNDELLKKTQKCWLERIKGDSNANFSKPLEIGERLNLRKFLGQVYYIAMVRTASLSSDRRVSQLLEPLRPTYPPGLNDKQRATLFQGNVSLGILRDTIARWYVSPGGLVPGQHQHYGLVEGSSELLFKETDMYSFVQKSYSDVLAQINDLISSGNLVSGRRVQLQDIYKYQSDNLDIHFLGLPD